MRGRSAADEEGQTGKAEAAEVELVAGGGERSHGCAYERGSRLNSCLGTVTT